jgi:hypothetical protein
MILFYVQKDTYRDYRDLEHIEILILYFSYDVNVTENSW